MSSYDPQATYDFIDFEGIKVGEVRRGDYFEGGLAVGHIEGDVFHFDNAPAGKLVGLTITRNDDATPFYLVPQESKQV